jgi:hypothetical protein
MLYRITKQKRQCGENFKHSDICNNQEDAHIPNRYSEMHTDTVSRLQAPFIYMPITVTEIITLESMHFMKGLIRQEGKFLKSPISWGNKEKNNGLESIVTV